MRHDYLFTSESVSEGHPDKVPRHNIRLPIKEIGFNDRAIRKT